MLAHGEVKVNVKVKFASTWESESWECKSESEIHLHLGKKVKVVKVRQVWLQVKGKIEDKLKYELLVIFLSHEENSKRNNGNQKGS